MENQSNGRKNPDLIYEGNIADLWIMSVIMKKIFTKPENTDAFKLGLIDDKFKVIRKPKTREEKNALTLLDKFIFKLLKTLGPLVTKLSSFLLLMDKDIQYKNMINEIMYLCENKNLVVLWDYDTKIGIIGNRSKIYEEYKSIPYSNRVWKRQFDVNEFMFLFGANELAQLQYIDEKNNLWKNGMRIILEGRNISRNN